MKKNLIILTALLLPLSQVSAQDKVKEKDLIGTWKLIIDIEEELEDAADDEESILGGLILGSVSGLINGILEEIDIYMEFRPDGEVKVMVEAFDENEVEYSEWTIENGRLYISDNDHLTMDDGDYWLINKDLLILYEERDGRNESVYMARVD